MEGKIMCPANVETMFYAGQEKPWHGLGQQINEAPTSADALRLAGLDWQVEGRKLFLENGDNVKGFVANVRDTDNRVLGVVTDVYKVVQNIDAFSFTDQLIGNGEIDVHYETAGSLANGRRTWMLARMPDETIVGDKFENFLVFTNSFDGTGAIRVAMTPVRVVCQNTLNLALGQAKRQWSVKHMGDVQGKIHEAQATLGLYSKYMSNLKEEADILAQKRINEATYMQFVNDLFPVIEDNTGASDRQIRNAEEVRNNFLSFRKVPYDLRRVDGTAWGLLNMVSDFVTHTKPQRLTGNYQENNFMKVVDGHPIFDRAYAWIGANA
jgi:phage/plasmid-like protein (TIGR03299 family)